MDKDLFLNTKMIEYLRKTVHDLVELVTKSKFFLEDTRQVSFVLFLDFFLSLAYLCRELIQVNLEALVLSLYRSK